MISIVIPIYNEEDRLKEGIDKIFSYIESSKRKFEVIVVNDGSTDSTAHMLKELREKFDFEIFLHPKNLGKGAAIKTGILNAKGDFILFTDIDLSVPINFIDKYMKVIEDADIVIGTREKEGSKMVARQVWVREVLGKFFILLSNFILWVGVSDFTCGFKLFRKKAAQTIFPKQIIKRWAFDAETLFLAKKFHFKILEVPVAWRDKKGSKVRFPKDLIETLISLFLIRLYDFSGKY